MTRLTSRSTATLLVGLLLAGSVVACTTHPGPTPSPTRVSSSSTGSLPSTTTAPAGPNGGGIAPIADPLPTLPDLSAPVQAPRSQTEQLLAAFSAEGGPTTQQAVDAFNLVVAPLPGASASALPATTADDEHLSVTAVLAAIVRHRDDLTPAQAAVVAQFENLPTGPPATTGSDPSTGAAVPEGTTASTGSTVPSTAGSTDPSGPAPAGHPPWPGDDPLFKKIRLETLFGQTLNDWRGYKPGILPVNAAMHVLFGTTTPVDIDGRAVMYTAPHNPQMQVQSDNPCDITVTPLGMKQNYSDVVYKFYFAHEIFHCIEFGWNYFLDVPPWLVEGGADWAAMDLYRGVDGIQKDIFRRWFTTQSLTLDQYEYSAWPIFESFAEEFSGDMYAQLKTMFSTHDAGTAAVLHAGGLDAPTFALLATSKSFRQQGDSAPNWDVHWQGPNVEYGDRDNGYRLPTHGIGTYQLIGQPNFSHQVYRLPLTSDVALVSVQPRNGAVLTRTDAGTVSVADGGQSWFCVTGKCKCPPGTVPDVPWLNVDPPMVFAFAQQATATTAAIRAMAWDEKKYCGQKQTPPRRPGNGAIGTANGDPHMTSLDGLHYDFMTLGEFTTTTDPRGGLTVQERHEPAGFGTSITAFAAGDGIHRITVTANTDAAVVVRIDGVPVTSAHAAAGTIQYDAGDNQWTLTWPDGSRVSAMWLSGFFLTVELSPARAARVVGLLGTGDDNVLDDLNLPNGTHALPDGPSGFATAWLVTDKTSLFDYALGQNTATFARPPSRVTPTVNPQVLRSCQQELGRQAAAYEVSACAYDVASTGNNAYAAAWNAVVAQRVSSVQSAPTASQDPGDDSEPVYTIGSESSSSTTAAPPPGGQGQGSAGPTLRLAGTVGGLADGPTGTIAVQAGAVIVARAACPADRTVNVSIFLSYTDDQDGSSEFLCGATVATAQTDRQDGDTSSDGEGYLLARQTGPLYVTLRSDAPTPTAVSVDLFTDATPVTVAPAGFSSDHWSGTLTGTADSALLWTSPAGGKTWHVSNSGSVCVGEFYGPELDDTGVWVLGTLCKHRSTVEIGPFDGNIPIVVFNRGETAVVVTVSP